MYSCVLLLLSVQGVVKSSALVRRCWPQACACQAQVASGNGGHLNLLQGRRARLEPSAFSSTDARRFAGLKKVDSTDAIFCYLLLCERAGMSCARVLLEFCHARSGSQALHRGQLEGARKGLVPSSARELSLKSATIHYSQCSLLYTTKLGLFQEPRGVP